MKLLPIYPRGLGTREVEGLGSFLMRSAAAHGMATPDFAVALVSHFSDLADQDDTISTQDITNRPVESRTGLTWPGGWASRLASLLNVIYETDLFTSLGLLRLYPEFRHFHRLFIRGFQWCPICWQQDLLRSQEPYFRYVWSLDGYNTCEIHECCLIDCCSQCGSKVTHSIRRRVCDCAKCGASLLEDKNGLRRRPISHSYRDVLEVVEFIQLNPEWRLKPDGANDLLPEFMLDYVEEEHRWTAQQRLASYQKKPTFIKLRRLCWFFGVDLWRVLASQNMQLPLLKPNDACDQFPPGMEVRAKVRPPGHDAVISQLKDLMHANSDLPQPAKFYAKEIGISTSGFQHRYPELYNRIVSFYEFHRRSERAKLKMEIEVVLALMKYEGSLSRGVKKICSELMSDWGFPKNVSREKIKEFRDSL